jgi:hypothetical protein
MAGAKWLAMRTAAVVLLSATLLYAASSAAQEATGRVRGIYYEASRGVLVDAQMLRRPGATRWLDVELDGDQAPEKKRQLVLLPRDMNAAIGDVVALRLGEPKSTQLAEVLPAVAVNRARAIQPHAPQFAGNASTGASSVK